MLTGTKPLRNTRRSILTSVLKKIDVAVLNAVKAVEEAPSRVASPTSALKDGGVDIAPLHDLASMVTPELQAQVDQAKADLISGAITVNGVLACPE